jgi:hypothetical protein
MSIRFDQGEASLDVVHKIKAPAVIDVMLYPIVPISQNCAW